MAMELIPHQGRVVPLGELIRLSKQLEARQPEEECGLFSMDSPQGQGLMLQADYFQKEAEIALDFGDFAEAHELYSNALMRAIQVRSNCIQLTLLFHGRSKICCELGEYDQALDDADLAIKCGPGYSECLLQLSKILKHKKQYERAFICVIAKLKNPEKLTLRVRADYVKLSVELAVEVKDGFKTVKGLQESKEIWNRVVSVLAAENQWVLLRSLLLGACPTVASIDASEINLIGLVFNKQVPWTEWGEQLAIALLKSGANYKTLCPMQKHPLQVALKVCLKKESVELLRHLCVRYPTEVTNWRSDDGDTLLHVACSSSSKSLAKVIRLLLKYNIDPLIANKIGKLAHQLLPESSRESNILRSKLTTASSVAEVSGEETKDKTKELEICKSKVSQTERHLQSISLDNNEKVYASKDQKCDLKVGTTEQHVVKNGLNIANKDEPTSKPFDKKPHEESGDKKLADTEANPCISWSHEDVERWLERNGLSEHKKKFEEFDGTLLAEMCWIQRVAPERFFVLLKKTLSLPLPDILQFSFSLRQIYMKTE